ncbi:hypothetical protein C7S20_17000 [Christiangramia fulva]|uniref:Uncharacterized protein n=1 Tax=Christiangramia fulva TaxID=2126553 RepID=A0A2R3Z968_9FLAO|nr:hypothetical protein [Christiangramia fulva]AVR46821.1 hypothetical protein C7S20_17000 [Christiangramia fulva]
MATKTIAILAESWKISPELLKVLDKPKLRLLFVAKDEDNKKGLIEVLKPLELNAEIDFTSCEKEGCWEADRIVVLKPEQPSVELIEKIKEVATQKPVWVISEDPEATKQVDLKQLLPNSRVIEIGLKEKTQEISLCGKDAEAKSEIRQFFENSDYQIKE